jgi:RNA 2',3'-cyclic 3'-phosphodiesterase
MRCFVALWPDEATRDRLDALARHWHTRFPRARRMRRTNLHLTLAFIGDLEPAAASLVATRLAGTAWPEGSWPVDRIGVFDKVRVLWAGSDTDPVLDSLAGRVRELLDDARVHFDRKAFAPHVTLLRNLPREAFGASDALSEPICWRIATPALLKSTATVDGVQYTPVEPAGA